MITLKKMFFYVLFGLSSTMPKSCTTPKDFIDIEPFGRILIFKPAPDVKPIGNVIFFTGDSGWNGWLVTIGNQLVKRGYVVEGVNTQTLFDNSAKVNGQCIDFNAHFNHLVKTLRESNLIAEDIKPILLGYSSGASLVYLAMALNPPEQYKAGFSLGFCPDIDVTKMPCSSSEVTFSAPKKKEEITHPFTATSQPLKHWYIFQGQDDKLCTLATVQEFISKIPGVNLTSFPLVGHGFNKGHRWMTQFEELLDKVQASR